jgi:acylphosphatase
MIKHIESGIAGRMMGSNSLSWIQDVATNLGVRGVVLTKPDGSIKVVAEGEEESLIEFTEKIKDGKIFSDMENFYIKWSDPKRDVGNFFVIAN